MNDAERRISERVPSRFKVNYVHKGDYLISHSRDLSVEGMFLHTDNPPAIGEKTSLEFNLQDGKSLQLEAEVVWTNKNAVNEDKGMAVKFIEPSNDTKQQITSYVRKIALLNA